MFVINNLYTLCHILSFTVESGDTGSGHGMFVISKLYTE